ncbi:MAG: B12-binding domain-containing radical SAM protein [Promethearchaeota archaeon]
MKVILIDTPAKELWEDRLEPNLGLLYLATFLSQHNFEVKIIDLRGKSQNKWENLIDFDGNIYGFSTFTPTYNTTLKILYLIKEKNPRAIFVAGGPHATALPQEVIKDFDYVIKGAGEVSLLELVRKISSGNIEKKKILEEKPIADINSLPFPDFSLCDLNSYKRHINGEKCLPIISSRGCPYNCIFCNSIIMGPNNKITMRSPENIVKEIELIKERYNVKSFRFNDDLFILNPKRVKILNKKLAPLSVIYRCFGRVDLCTKSVAEALVHGGCVHISFGIESGSQKILNILNKQLKVGIIRKNISIAKKSGLTTRIYLIIGTPGETWDTIQETVDLVLKCRPDEFEVYNLIPYPGTTIFNNLAKYGITYLDKNWDKYWQTIGNKESGYVFRTDKLNEEIISQMRSYVINKLSPLIKWAGESKHFK